MTTELHAQQAALTTTAWHRGTLVTVLVSGAQTHGRFTLIRTRETKGREPPRHLHQHEDEIIYVLEGQLQFFIGEARRDAVPGSCVLLPRGIEHGFVLRSTHASLLVMLLPAGLEGYFHELDQPATPPETPHDDTNLQIEHLIAVAVRYGVEITGPAEDDQLQRDAITSDVIEQPAHNPE